MTTKGKEKLNTAQNQNVVARAIYRYARISPKKVAPVVRMIRRKSIKEATDFLTFDTTKASKLVLKSLNSALSNAKQKGLNEDNLFVFKAVVDKAPTFKRGRAGSRYHFNPILKRNSHITIELSTGGGYGS